MEKKIESRKKDAGEGRGDERGVGKDIAMPLLRKR